MVKYNGEHKTGRNEFIGKLIMNKLYFTIMKIIFDSAK